MPAYGTFTGQFVYAAIDGADANTLPDEKPYKGTIEFIPTVDYTVETVLEPNPKVWGAQSFTAVLDTAGYVSTPNPVNVALPAYRGLTVIANDDPNMSVDVYQYRVEYHLFTQNDVPANIRTHFVSIGAGEIVDLSVPLETWEQPRPNTVYVPVDLLSLEVAIVRVVSRQDIIKRITDEAVKARDSAMVWASDAATSATKATTEARAARTAASDARGRMYRLVPDPRNLLPEGRPVYSNAANSDAAPEEGTGTPGGPVLWSQIDLKPDAFPPEAHTHDLDDVYAVEPSAGVDPVTLRERLDSKADRTDLENFEAHYARTDDAVFTKIEVPTPIHPKDAVTLEYLQSQTGIDGVPASATNETQGVIILAGDLAGTYDQPTVPGLAGKADRIELANRPTASEVAEELQKYATSIYVNDELNKKQPLIEGGLGTKNQLVQGDYTTLDKADLPLSNKAIERAFELEGGSSFLLVENWGSSTSSSSFRTLPSTHRGGTILATVIGNVTLQMPAVPELIDGKGRSSVITFIIRQGPGSKIVTWPNTVKWSGGTKPTLSTAANAIDVVTVISDGTGWLAFLGGLNFA